MSRGLGDVYKRQIRPSVNGIPQTFEERSSYLIRRFFIQHAETIDIYELCDELYLSYSSIKLLLGRMNKKYEAMHCRFACRSDAVYVEGSERDKRRFLTSIVHEESNGRFIDLQLLKEIFPDVDVDRLHAILHTTFERFGYYINDFAYTNLSLHLIIILNRISNGNVLIAHATASHTLHEVSIAVIEQLQACFQLTINASERDAIDELIMMNLCLCQAKNEHELIPIVGKESCQIALSVISALNRQYHLNLNQSALLLPLALHFKNLFSRFENNTSLKNPLLDTIRTSCPILFDCAVFVADYLEKEYHVSITEDEIAYIAMHIGADIERQKQDDAKLQCVLLCPNYQNLQSELCNALLIHFDAQICIIACCSYEEELAELDYDLLFTTIEPINTYEEVIKIAPFASGLDLTMIFTRIQELLDHRRLQILSRQFPHFFSPVLFLYADDAPQSQEEVLRSLSERLHAQGAVPPSFLRDVLKREKAASTAFGDVAVPHSLHMDAKQTAVAVLIAPKGVKWEGQLVHVVLLIAINEQDSHLFQKLYEALILLFSQPHFLKRLRDCRSFADFSALVLSHTEK